MKRSEVWGRSPALIGGIALLFGVITTQAQEGGVRAPHQHHPMVLHHISNSTAYSYNWSGYAVTGANGSFNTVSGSWVVPAVTCPTGRHSSSTYSSFWVGLDGWTSGSVEQLGTDSDCSNGHPAYYAWYEMYPSPSYYAGNLRSLQPGDLVNASVTYNTNGTFTLSINVNGSGGGVFSITPPAPSTAPARSSAEWITEAPSSGKILPLSNFGNVCWGPNAFTLTSSCTSTTGGNNLANGGTIGSFGANVNEALMVNNSGTTVISQPSVLASDGNSFYVTRENPSVP